MSLAVIGLELTLMRSLSLRFWSHFAYMVVGVALLGFGASGTAITLLRRRIVRSPRGWLCGLALAFALSVPLSFWAAQRVPLDVQYLSWSFRQAGNVLLIELLILVPLGLGGAFVGVALMDAPRRIGGHYAANLAGSGIGAVAAVAAMFVLDVHGLVVACAAAAYMGAAVLLPWRRAGAVLLAGVVAAGLGAAAWAMPREQAVSPYKMLAQAATWPGTRTVHHNSGPLGRIDVVAGPAIHYAPGLSLQYGGPIPPHALLLVDGEPLGAVYDCRDANDWRFMDHTTAAAAYHLRPRSSACIVGAGGGADIGLAVHHRSRRIVALEMNGQIIDAMTGPLRDLGGRVYEADAVEVLNAEARGFFAAAGEPFDVIQLPAIDAFGASGAGLYASQESYLYTVESFAAMLGRLAPGGVLAVTRWSRMPPRDELRAFDIARAALARRDAEPARRLAMIRSWATVTVLAFADPITPAQADALRAFCKRRSFDLCYLPGMDEGEANQFHVLDEPYYFRAARDLLGPRREQFIADYLFGIEATTDQRPYFYHSFRWRALPVLRDQLHGAGRAFLEAGYLMAVAALAQAVILAVVLILLPLAPGVRALRGEPGRAASLGYFLLLGAGFMLLEMGFLQRLILYLAAPIYSAAAVIASFLIFAGLGSRLSGAWPARAKRVGTVAAAVVACAAVAYLLAMDGWLRLTQPWPMAARFAVAALTIAPLAVAMGHLFPTGLRLIGGGAPALVPWAWAVNGFASVAATVGAPLAAMAFGFAPLTLAAVGCYILAGILVNLLPGEPPREERMT